jgi:hypothetical protein
MNLILFSEEEAVKQQLISAVQVAELNGSVEIFPTPETFYQRLRQPRVFGTIVIIALQQRRTLETFAQAKELLKDIRTIIVPPDDDMETIVKAHLLRPRFVIFKEDISGKLSMVLTKMNCSGN